MALCVLQLSKPGSRHANYLAAPIRGAPGLCHHAISSVIPGPPQSLADEMNVKKWIVYYQDCANALLVAPGPHE